MILHQIEETEKNFFSVHLYHPLRTFIFWINYTSEEGQNIKCIP